jgi:hypothetical protein
VSQYLEATVDEVDDFCCDGISKPLVRHYQKIEGNVTVQSPDLKYDKFQVEDRVHASNFLPVTIKIHLVRHHITLFYITFWNLEFYRGKIFPKCTF